jgi:hypothetical protein
MLKQKARAIALGVLAGDLLLTAISLPVAYVIRHGVLRTISPTIFSSPLHPFDRYLSLLILILPFWALMLYAAGFYRSHRTLPLAEEIWAATKVAIGGTAQHALLRWYDEGLDALRTSPSDGREILRRYGTRVVAEAERHALAGDDPDAEIDSLIAETRATHRELTPKPGGSGRRSANAVPST